MLSTISILSMLLIGCGNSTKKEEAPAKTEQQIKDEAKAAAEAAAKAEEAKKAEEAAKAAEEAAKAEEAKAALKEEIKEELKEEEAAKAAEEAAKKPKKKAAPAQKTFSARITVDELPLNGRKLRFEAAAKSALNAMAGKAGYNTLKSLDIPAGKPNCKGGKCFKKVKGTFTK